MNIIEAKNIGKKYAITHKKGGYIALRDILTNIFRNPFNFLKSKTKEIIGVENKEIFWALKNINFTINKGEVVGIIGRNGAGKSTLLKILSQITPPTTGEIIIHGTIGSLLEVGTGFHPELTGRENIFLNGAILGMKKREIIEKFNDIVSFAGIEKFIDTPVKYYSSGMYVRLAFSVAAHMEPDILIVDEVLAVGDAEFQKKCLGKMEEITKKEGRTILFVSHNITVIKQLCTKCIWLSKGQVKMIGETQDVVDMYLSEKIHIEENPDIIYDLNTKNLANDSITRFNHLKISNQDGDSFLKSSDRLIIEIGYESDFDKVINDPRIVITIINDFSKNVVLRLDSNVTNEGLSEKINPNGKFICETKNPINLIEGFYTIDIDFLVENTSVHYVGGAGKFEVITNLKDYNYKNYPDKSVCDFIITHSFK